MPPSTPRHGYPMGCTPLFRATREQIILKCHPPLVSAFSSMDHGYGSGPSIHQVAPCVNCARTVFPIPRLSMGIFYVPSWRSISHLYRFLIHIVINLFILLWDAGTGMTTVDLRREGLVGMYYTIQGLVLYISDPIIPTWKSLAFQISNKLGLIRKWLSYKVVTVGKRPHFKPHLWALMSDVNKNCAACHVVVCMHLPGKSSRMVCIEIMHISAIVHSE